MGSRTIAAQDARHAGHDGAHERMEIYLVLRAVVDGGRRLSSTMLLLAGMQDAVSICTLVDTDGNLLVDEMLSTSLRPTLLQA